MFSLFSSASAMTVCTLPDGGYGGYGHGHKKVKYGYVSKHGSDGWTEWDENAYDKYRPIKPKYIHIYEKHHEYYPMKHHSYSKPYEHHKESHGYESYHSPKHHYMQHGYGGYMEQQHGGYGHHYPQHHNNHYVTHGTYSYVDHDGSRGHYDG